MPRPSAPRSSWKSRAALRCALAAAAAAGPVIAWPRVAAWQQRRFAEQLAHHALANPAATEDSVRHLWQLGLPATGPLVQLATVQRPEAALAAQDGLANQLTAWAVAFSERGEAGDYAKQLAALSEALRDSYRELDADGQLWAKKLARQMLLACDRLPPEEAWGILAACEEVLTAAATPRPATELPAEPSQSVFPEATAIAEPVIADVAEPPHASPEAPRPEGLSTELSVIMPSAQPAWPATKARAHALATDNSLRGDEFAAPLPEPAAEVTAAANAATPPEPAVIDVPSPLDMRHARQRLRELADHELIALSVTAPRFEAAAARSVLRMRGYSDELLKLTGELQALPAPERREALDRAITLPAAEARRLLRWFVADEDAEVRLHALTMLATTGDPQLYEIARRRAIEDADPRVAELAAKLME